MVIACALPVLYALAVWWVSTGLLLWLVRLPLRTHTVSITGATAMLGLALHGLATGGSNTTAAGAYLAFTCAILAWAWPEMTFLTGRLTGPWRQACPVGCRGFSRARYAVQAILYHELALIAVGTGVVSVTWGAPNQVGVWTFVLLWTMRLSAKLNLFLGVRFFNDEVLPERLRYLKSFGAARPINPVFVVSITAATAAATVLAGKASGAASPFEFACFALLTSLLALAILEHWFMLVPLPAASLWGWWLGALAAPSGPAIDEAAGTSSARLRLAARGGGAVSSAGGSVSRSESVDGGVSPRPASRKSACERLQEQFRQEFAARRIEVDAAQSRASACSDPASTSPWRGR